jgi:hypothetical protein
MKSFVSLTVLALAALSVACSPKQPQVKLTNMSDFDLVEKPISIDRSILEAKYGELDASKIPFLAQGKTLVPCQFEDLDGDGAWDQLFTLVDLKAGEQKSFTLELKDKANAPEVKVRTNIRFADKNDPNLEFTTAERLKSNTTEISQQYFQMEGPAFENDVVGFRNYFDARNGFDIFGKITSDMVMDICGLKGGPTYHEMQPWGMDILKVANSLGAGALAIQTDSALYRVGEKGNGTFSLVCEGPLRSTFDLDFDSILVEGKVIQLKHRICIIAGKPWYKSNVTVQGADGMKLVTGIVNLHSDSVHSAADEEFAYMYTHDNQAFDGEKLGMAVIVAQSNIVALAAPEEGPGITQTFYTPLEIGDKPTVFYFMAGWEKQDARWADRAQFEEGVKEQGRLIAAKVNVEIL